MIDREARDKLAEALRQFGSGRITSVQFAAAITMNTRDKAVKSIGAGYLGIVADEEECRLPDVLDMNRRERSRIARAVLFLYSDLEYRWEPRALSLWTIPLLTPLLLAGLIAATIALLVVSAAVQMLLADVGMHVDIPAAFCMTMAIVTLLLALPLSLRERVWPFFRRRDLENELGRPRLLCGKTRST